MLASNLARDANDLASDCYVNADGGGVRKLTVLYYTIVM